MPVKAFGEGILWDAAELWQLFSMLRSNLTSLLPWAQGTGKTSQEITNGARPCFRSAVPRFERARLWGTAFHSLCSPGTAAPASHLCCWRKAMLRDQELEILSCRLDHLVCDSLLCQPLLSRLQFRSHLLYFCQTPTSIQPYFNIWKNICCSAVAICYHPQEARPKISRDFEEQC